MNETKQDWRNCPSAVLFAEGGRKNSGGREPHPTLQLALQVFYGWNNPQEVLMKGNLVMTKTI